MTHNDSPRPPSRGMETMVAIVGVGIAVFGLVSWNWPVVGFGAVFVAFGVGFRRRALAVHRNENGPEPAKNLRHGWWFQAVFIAVGALVMALAAADGDLGAVATGGVFVAAGTVMAVMGRRSHDQATPTEDTVASLVANGWQDATTGVRTDRSLIPDAVAAQLKLGRSNDPRVAELCGIDPSGIQAAATRTDAGDETVTVAEAWTVRSTHKMNERVVGGDVEPRVVAWTQLPASVGTVTVRPDNARMKLADLTGAVSDHKVDWEAVDGTWHLHGDDEALLRAVVDIGLMGRLAELPGRWIVRIAGDTLMVIPTADRNRLAAPPPALADVADDIADVLVAVRRALPQMLWSDLESFLAGYR